MAAKEELIPPLLTADVELPVAAKLEEIDESYDPSETITINGKIPGPYANNQALLNVYCYADAVVVSIHIQRWDLPKELELKSGKTRLRHLGDEYRRYGEIVGETVANELGLIPDAYGEAVANHDEIVFTHYRMRETDSTQPNRLITFSCEFKTECFWELEDLWE